MIEKMLAMIAGTDTSMFTKYQVSECFNLTKALAFQTWYLIPRDEDHFLTPLAGIGYEVFMASRSEGAATMRKSDDPRHRDYDEIVEFPNVPNAPKQYYGFGSDVYKQFMTYTPKKGKQLGTIGEIKISLSLNQINQWLHDAHHTGGDAHKLPNQIYRQFLARSGLKPSSKTGKTKVGYNVRELVFDDAGNLVIDKAIGRARKLS
jgi:hypothetical protein